MNTLLVVISHPGAAEIVKRNSATWKLSGADIVGVEHEDKPAMQWPHASEVWRIGSDPGKTRHLWVGRFMKIVECCLQRREYDLFCFCEADTVFVRPIPDKPSSYPQGTLAGYQSDPFLGSEFYHCPWTFPDSVLASVHKAGERLLRLSLNERGFIDRWFGLIGDLYPELAFEHSGNYSRNTIEHENIAEAVEAARNPNCWALHGCKTQECFDALTK